MDVVMSDHAEQVQTTVRQVMLAKDMAAACSESGSRQVCVLDVQLLDAHSCSGRVTQQAAPM